MKTLTAVAAIALVSFGFTTTASAFKLSPPSTSFTGSGNTSLTKSGITVPCTANFTGSINARGVGKVTGATFTGSATCQAISATGLPWKVAAKTASTAKFSAVSVSTPLGNCGPSALTVGDNGTGLVTFTNQILSGGCSVSGSVQTTPAVTIVP